LAQGARVAGLYGISGVGGAESEASWSDVRLPSSDGGVLDLGTLGAKYFNASGEIGILDDGVRGRGDCFGKLWIFGQ